VFSDQIHAPLRGKQAKGLLVFEFEIVPERPKSIIGTHPRGPGGGKSATLRSVTDTLLLLQFGLLIQRRDRHFAADTVAAPPLT
jgi:hypothetical protein